MPTLTVISQKGGTGDVMVAPSLAVAGSSAGRSARVVDLDPQASATAWSDQCQKDEPVAVAASRGVEEFRGRLLEHAEPEGREAA